MPTPSFSPTTGIGRPCHGSNNQGFFKSPNQVRILLPLTLGTPSLSLISHCPLLCLVLLRSPLSPAALRVEGAPEPLLTRPHWAAQGLESVGDNNSFWGPHGETGQGGRTHTLQPQPSSADHGSLCNSAGVVKVWLWSFLTPGTAGDSSSRLGQGESKDRGFH